MNPTRRTITYYDLNADHYLELSSGVDLGHLYRPFTHHLPDGARILDAGCGPGRDARVFAAMGYRVTAFDGSEKMVDMARKDFDGPVHHMRFEDVEWQSEFDGIWAMASLLHVPRGELPGIIERLGRALVPGGVFFMSFKEGPGDRVKDGRIYTDFTESGLDSLLRQSKRMKLERVWISDDFLSPDRPRWTNAIALRTGTP